MRRLLGTLINPCPDQADLLVSQFFGLFGHVTIRVTDVGDGKYQVTMGAVAGREDGSVAIAFQDTGERVQRKVCRLFGLLTVMAFQAGRVKNGFDVRGVSDSCLGGCRGQGAVGIGRQAEGQKTSKGHQDGLVCHFHGVINYLDS